MMCTHDKRKSYDDVKLGVDVDDFAVLVDDWQRGDAMVDEDGERLDERCVAARLSTTTRST